MHWEKKQYCMVAGDAKTKKICRKSKDYLMGTFLGKPGKKLIRSHGDSA
jgi:hypothetical protein